MAAMAGYDGIQRDHRYRLSMAVGATKRRVPFMPESHRPFPHGLPRGGDGNIDCQGFRETCRLVTVGAVRLGRILVMAVLTPARGLELEHRLRRAEVAGQASELLMPGMGKGVAHCCDGSRHRNGRNSSGAGSRRELPGSDGAR